ncbi:DUF835 domain-containing protein [Pyrococcus yayanosii]|uniref:DUF835 domain-containing protein n=1 Tax=Pyrococcus yayanosii (strain CH1 / JCM 16557) TaxID=529709 RepID=F8AJE0_PYRYC|nr:DUF835 domain-containing protein [Pyrococcus yayanosii]AEH24933.1 hypothetical protein PYCH_12590 [Pyrococcus yayanosii CH1]
MLWQTIDIIRMITFIVKVSAAAYIFHVYFKTGRRSAFVMALALITYAIHTLFDILQIPTLGVIFVAITSSLFLLTSILLLGEDDVLPTSKLLGILPLTPLILTLYSLLLGFHSSNLEAVMVGTGYGISGFFTFLAGLFLLRLRDIYRKDSMLLILSLSLIGLHEMDYPFLRPVEWFAPIGFTIATVLVFTLVYGVIRFVRSEEYFKIRSQAPTGVQKGPMIINVEDFQTSVLPKIANVQALAFLRNIDGSPSWHVYFVTQALAEHDRNIGPTNLPRMLELTRKYLSAFEGGVVILDCPEYLALYNGFDALLKFLATLRDMTLMRDGTLIVVTDRSAWDEKQWKLLQKVVGG